MRLALVTETFPPEVNGVAMTLGRLVDGLRSRGWETQVVRPRQKDESFKETDHSLDSRELILPSLPLPGYEGLRMGTPSTLTLLREWRSWRPSIIHVATEGPLGLGAIFVANELGIPVSSTFHTNFHQYSSHYKLGLVMNLIFVYLRVVHNACSCTLAPTTEMAKVLDGMGFKNTGVLSRGVDTELFSPDRRNDSLRQEWGVSPDDRVYLYVGRVAKEKNIGLAVEAFLTLREHQAGAKFVIVGDGPEKTGLESRYPEFIYAGMRKGEDLAQHYASGDVFLFPSVTETFGNVVTEALSSGLVVATFDYAAGRQYIVNEANGFLVPFDDSISFIGLVQRLGEKENASLEPIRAAARETALGVSWNRIVDDFQTALARAQSAYSNRASAN